jgi:hypothetical protein
MSIILMDGSIGYFDSYHEIMDAWKRLQTKEFYKQDIDLIRHEYFEAKFEKLFKTNYRVAHDAAEKSGRKWDPEVLFENINKPWRR